MRRAGRPVASSIACSAFRSAMFFSSTQTPRRIAAAIFIAAALPSCESTAMVSSGVVARDRK
jgi:hypothetical protein